VMKMATDITELKLLQNQLRESQERYRQLFEEVPCYISIQDPELRIVEANRRFREDFGDFLGKKCYQVYMHRSQECIPCTVKQTFQDGQGHQSEEVVTSQKGEQVNVLVSTSPVRNTEGQIKHVIEMSANITQIRELQSQLTSLGLVISSISHGIKGLLTGLDGGMYILNSGIAKENHSQVKEGWEIVKQMVERIRKLVLDILFYAKDRELNYERIDILAFAEEMAREFEPRMRAQQIEFNKQFDPVAGAFEVDGACVHSALINIIENAIDACGAGQLQTASKITFGVSGHESRVVFEVSDNGVGMDADTLEKIFTPLFSSKGSRGTGLGLFISNTIIVQHGGSINVNSNPGQGTLFQIEIPRKRAVLANGRNHEND